MEFIDDMYGTEAQIQLPLKRFPDSSVSSLASYHQKLTSILMGG